MSPSANTSLLKGPGLWPVLSRAQIILRKTVNICFVTWPPRWQCQPDLNKAGPLLHFPWEPAGVPVSGWQHLSIFFKKRENKNNLDAMKAGTRAFLKCFRKSEASLVIDDIYGLIHMKYCLLKYHLRALLSSQLRAFMAAVWCVGCQSCLEAWRM